MVDAGMPVAAPAIVPPAMNAMDEDGGTDPDEDGGMEPTDSGTTLPADAGAAPDDGGMDAGAPAVGHCARACVTAQCGSATDVCSSPTGICREGCDQTRSECPDKQACDFGSKLCKPKSGDCRGASVKSCFALPALLTGRAERSCISEFCRLDPVQAVGKSVFDLPEITVRYPLPGERIVEPSKQPFMLTPLGDVTIAVILSGVPDDVPTAAKLALWAAYLPSPDAHKILVGAGGAMMEGHWLQQSPTFVDKQPLYFMVLAYKREKLVAASLAIPFTFGPPWQQPDESCDADGALCDNDRAPLVCVEDRCKRACLSDDDCAVGSCSLPRPVSGSRVCL
jgi:hypothetical protein